MITRWQWLWLKRWGEGGGSISVRAGSGRNANLRPPPQDCHHHHHRHHHGYVIAYDHHHHHYHSYYHLSIQTVQCINNQRTSAVFCRRQSGFQLSFNATLYYEVCSFPLMIQDWKSIFTSHQVPRFYPTRYPGLRHPALDHWFPPWTHLCPAASAPGANSPNCDTFVRRDKGCAG